MESRSDGEYLDALDDLSAGYEKELAALREGFAALDASNGASVEAARLVARRVQALGQRGRSLKAPALFAESHAVYLRGIAEFDLAMETLLAVTQGENVRGAPELIRDHFDAGMKLVSDATLLLYRLVED